jgi:hypothetical protein
MVELFLSPYPEDRDKTYISSVFLLCFDTYQLAEISTYLYHIFAFGPAKSLLFTADILASFSSPVPKIILPTNALGGYEDHLCSFCWPGDKGGVWQVIRYPLFHNSSLLLANAMLLSTVISLTPA